jgi:uncharacterized protein (TIGR03083 family)
MTALDASTIPSIDHAEAMRLQEVELSRYLDLLRSLTPDDWTAQTDCPDWDVRRMSLHVLGASEAGASMRENAHQMRKALAHRSHVGGSLEAALSGAQVLEREPMTPHEVLTRLAAIAPATVRGRTRLPGLLRTKVKIKVDAPVVERWTLGYLVDVIYLRDLWMHRVDTARATGREMVLDADHDGRIVADVVAEWARRHGQAFTLTLTGPAGGMFTSGEGGEVIEIDAVELCRTVSGRAEGTGLLATVVPF